MARRKGLGRLGSTARFYREKEEDIMGSERGPGKAETKYKIGREGVAGAQGFEPWALGFGDRCSDQAELRPYPQAILPRRPTSIEA